MSKRDRVKLDGDKMEEYQSSHCSIDMEAALIRDLITRLPGDSESVTWMHVAALRYVTLMLREARKLLQAAEAERAN